MKEIEFNLLDEAWIRVRLNDNSIQEVSLTDALLHAHEYVDLAGETQTQDAAMLRLLLSIPLTIFYRMDTEGQEAPLTTADEALLRWRSLWSQGHFPEKPVREYLEKWHERFWLFHPERPFWQVPEAAIGTEYPAEKLNGEISKSKNKNRMFLTRIGESKDKLTYSEAARWLVNIQSWDDVASKTGTGVGWLGKIGFVQAVGENLFKTLMLNMTMLEDGQKLWRACTPQWEINSLPNLGTKDVLVNGFVEMLTQTSRSVILIRNGHFVTGFSCNGGYSFETKNQFFEQMTIWKKRDGSRNEPEYYNPETHDSAKQLWREFPSMINANKDTHIPGVVRWISLLQRRILDRKKQCCFRSVGITYGSSNSSIADIFDNELSFQMNILDDCGVIWRTRITEEIGKCEKAASYVGGLQKDLALAGGFSYSDKTKGTLEKQAEMMRGEFYFAIDDPFRRWLRSIDGEEDDIDEKMLMWQKICRSIAINIGRRMVQESSSTAMIGHKLKVKERTELMTSAKAFVIFQSRIRSLYPKNEKEGE